MSRQLYGFACLLTGKIRFEQSGNSFTVEAVFLAVRRFDVFMLKDGFSRSRYDNYIYFRRQTVKK